MLVKLRFVAGVGAMPITLRGEIAERLVPA